MITTTTRMLEGVFRACMVVRGRKGHSGHPKTAGVMVEGGDLGAVYTATDGQRILRIRLASSQPECRIVIPDAVVRMTLEACAQHRKDNTRQEWIPETDRYEDEYTAPPVQISKGSILLPAGVRLTFEASNDLQLFMDKGGDPKPDLWPRILPRVRDSGGVAWQGVTSDYLGDIGPIMKALRGDDHFYSHGRLQLGDEDLSPLRFDAKDGETEVAYVLMPLRTYDRVEAGDRLLSAQSEAAGV